MSSSSTQTEPMHHGLPGTRHIDCQINGNDGTIYVNPDFLQLFFSKKRPNFKWIFLSLVFLGSGGYIYSFSPIWSIVILSIGILFMITGLLSKVIIRETVVFYKDSAVFRKHSPPNQPTPKRTVFEASRTVDYKQNGKAFDLIIAYGAKKWKFKIEGLRPAQAKYLKL